MAWDIVYYAPNGGMAPAISFLDACPKGVKATILAILNALAEAPPPQFAGGGKWEAMRKAMSGYHEIRVTGRGREQFRLFCILENAHADELARRGLTGPAIAVITGLRKPWRTVFTEADYARVRDLGNAYLASYPRQIAT